MAEARVATPSTNRLATFAIGALIVWLPLQTPVAMFAYQYLHAGVAVARAILLLKDLVVLALLAALGAFLYGERRLTASVLRPRWFDVFALGYVALLGVYSVIPFVLGTRLAPLAVVASLREFLFPVELYLLGRVAWAAGASTPWLVRVFLVVAVASAMLTVGLLVLVPPTFWATTLDLPTFEREVQGIAGAHTLWDVSLLGQYGVGDAGSFPRAVGPFTHPVGTAHYFVLALLLLVGIAASMRRPAKAGGVLVVLGALVIVAVAVITPISRGSWVAAVVGIMVIAMPYRRVLVAGAAVTLVALVLVLTPPYSYSISSALSRSDSSAVGHENAIQRGIDVVGKSPAGLGVGQSDTFGAALSATGAEESAGVGENMYLAILVAVGPLGLATFLGWMAGLLLTLAPRRRVPGDWTTVSLFAAMLGYAASAMTASPLMRFTTSGTFWLFVGLAIANQIALSSSPLRAVGPFGPERPAKPSILD